MRNSPPDMTVRLKKASLRATFQRTELLGALVKAGKPLTALELAGMAAGKADLATVYRSLAVFERKGLVRRVDLRQNGAAFEYEDPSHHHHHVICTRCGRIEAIGRCDFGALKRSAIASTGFSRVTGHAIELFGVCTPCSKRAS